MKISRAASPLRTEYFQTVERDDTRSISIGYTGTSPDPRIDAAFLDEWDARRHAFGCLWHYVIRVDGSIEIGRDPRTRSTRLKNHWATTEGIHIGIVGGMDPETGDYAHTITPEQDAAVEGLMQSIANALNVPLEVYDAREGWMRRQAQDAQKEETEAEDEAVMDAQEALANRA